MIMRKNDERRVLSNWNRKTNTFFDVCVSISYVTLFRKELVQISGVDNSFVCAPRVAQETAAHETWVHLSASFNEDLLALLGFLFLFVHAL